MVGFFRPSLFLCAVRQRGAIAAARHWRSDNAKRIAAVRRAGAERRSTAAGCGTAAREAKTEE